MKDSRYWLSFEFIERPDTNIHSWCQSARKYQDIFCTRSVISSNIDSKILLEFQQKLDQLSINSRQYKQYCKIHRSQDWRLGDIDIITVDLDDMNTDQPKGEPTIGKSLANTLGPLLSKYMGYGCIRLYRDGDGDDDHDVQSSADNYDNDKTSSNDENATVAILAVPSYFSPADLLGFIGSKAQEDVLHIRMIKTSAVNRFMILIKFRDSTKAKEFHKEYNGKLFNSMEAESCHVVFIRAIHFETHVTRSEDDIPYLLEDVFTKNSDQKDGNEESAASGGIMQRPKPPMQSSLRELPTCPVCLERMDVNVSGLLTILCQHTFHCQCLSKWGDGSCPVCRYSQRSTSSTSNSNSTAVCAVCHSNANIWICLICGHQGCGRYDQAHAFDHYVATGHCFSMDITTQRVWDYASDQYVHRLIQNQADGKLVELPSGSGGGGGSGTSQQGSSQVRYDDDVYDDMVKKNEDIYFQYSQNLASQLDSQRMYYEDLCRQAADQAKEANERAEIAHQEIEDLNFKVNQLLSIHQESQQLKELNKKYLYKVQKLQDANNKLQESLKEEQMMSKQMLIKLNVAQDANNNQNAEIVDLQDQLRDMMLHLEAREKIEDNEEIQNGQLLMPANESKMKKKKSK